MIAIILNQLFETNFSKSIISNQLIIKNKLAEINYSKSVVLKELFEINYSKINYFDQFNQKTVVRKLIDENNLFEKPLFERQ